MSNIFGTFDANGLTLTTQADLLAYFTAQFQAIYGNTVDLDPDTPDGQWINILIQSALDLQDLLASINSSFDPDNAVGVTLDQRVAINGIQREGGSYTVTPVTLITSQSLNLYGLDQTVQPVYTVADASGNQWQLQTTQISVAIGTNVFDFQAANAGAVIPTPNTITVPVTVVLGVTSINNPGNYLSLGVNEESDAVLKVRRQKSVANASQGYLAGLIGVLQNISGVTYADVFENITGTTDGNGIPGHSIWVIVGGSGAASAIAEAIYTKRNAGCGMYGAISYAITQVDGSTFNVYWDDVVSQPLFIAFTVTSINGTVAPNIAAIRAGLVTGLTPGVAAEVNINEVATAVQVIDPNTLVTNATLALARTGPYYNIISPTLLKNQFQITAADIIILPMQITPSSATIPHGDSATFLGLGGYGAYTYTLSVNNSGGGINSSSGVYTAGSTSSVSDTVLVTDSLGNTATAVVAVT